MSLTELRKNPLMLTDCYNLSHQRLKINTDWEVSHMYNRAKGQILFGFQEIVNTILSIQITKEMVKEAEAYGAQMGLKFPTELFMRVVDECNGYFPIKVQALPEGTWCPAGTPFAQIRNSVEGFGELVTWFEGVFMMAYFPSTLATQAYRMRKYLEQKKRQYGYDGSFLNRFHSFGFRGSRSLEDAYWASSAWNLFLLGTDDFHSIMHHPESTVGSIAALAHKVTQQFDDEYEGFRHAIRTTAEAGEKVVALVIDTYDANNVIHNYLYPLAQYAKSEGVHIVMRPDSGDTWAQAVDIYRIVERSGFDNVSVILGEGMDFETAKKADIYFEEHGVPLSFVAYGIGSGFYNYVTRDTIGWAMKTSYSNGQPRMKFSMVPLKRSIPGIVALYRDSEYDDMRVSLESDIPMDDNLYNVIYYHHLLSSKPVIADKGDWVTTRERARKQDTSQHVIYLDSNIDSLIREFSNKYRGQ